MAQVPIMHENEDSLNACRIMGASVFEKTHLGSGPEGEGPNRPRGPNWCIKERSINSRHKKHHALSVSAVSCPSCTSTLIGDVTTSDWDGTMSTWSNLDNFLHNLCVSNNLDACCFHTDDGVWVDGLA